MSDMRKTEFEMRLQKLINSMSMELESSTPDFILAQYMMRCLEAYNAAIIRRNAWYGRDDPEERTSVLDREPR